RDYRERGCDQRLADASHVCSPERFAPMGRCSWATRTATNCYMRALGAEDDSRCDRERCFNVTNPSPGGEKAPVAGMNCRCDGGQGHPPGRDDSGWIGDGAGTGVAPEHRRTAWPGRAGLGSADELD